MQNRSALKNEELSSDDWAKSLVITRGRPLRFDEFSNEYLSSHRHGFYSKVIDLSKNHDPVHTPMNYIKGYDTAYATMVIAFAFKFAQLREKNSASILEIGIGGGELMRAMPDVLEERKRVLGNFSYTYTGMDINHNHLIAAYKNGFRVVEGTTHSLPFNNESFDIIVAEEVLDTFPYQIFRWNKQYGIFDSEGFVELHNNNLSLQFYPIDVKTPEILEIESRLHAYQFQGSYYRYAPQYSAFWHELKRVLGPGGLAVISDYSNESPINLDYGCLQEKAIVSTSCQTDLTHTIDFFLQAELATKAGFEYVDTIPQDEIYSPSDRMGIAFKTARFSGRKILLASREIQ